MTTRRILAAFLGALMALSARAGAPSIPLHDLDGRERNVNEFIGHAKWTIVVAWAHDCHFCESGIDEMAAFHTAHHDKGCHRAGHNPRRRSTAEGGTRIREAPQAAVCESHHRAVPAVMMKFGAGNFVGTPTYYVYDPKGEIVGQNTGPLTRTEVEEFITSFDKAPQNDK